MNVPRNFSAINQTVLDVDLIIPEGENRTNFNFTWNITDFQATAMDLQLYFASAYYVTALEQLSVKVLNRNFFISNENLKTLSDDNLMF